MMMLSASQTSAPYFVAMLRDGRLVTEGIAEHCDGEPSLGGIHARWKWDGKALRATTDRYGLCPLLYYITDDRVAVSTSLSMLVNAIGHNEPDPNALAVFFHLGYFLGEDTPIQNIKVLGPGGHLVWRADGKTVSSRRPEIDESIVDMSFEQAAERYIELFKASIEKRLPQDSFVLPLSGGKDSRHILFELVARGNVPEECITASMYPPRNDADIDVAQQICDVLKLNHVSLDRLPRFHAELRKNQATNFCTDEHTWMMALADHLRGRTVVSYDGIAGDVLSASRMAKPQYHELFKAGRQHELADMLLRRDASPLFAVLPGEWQVSNPRDLVKERLIVEMEKVQDWPNPVNALYFWSRTRREIALLSYGVLRDICPTFSPFLDDDLFDFLVRLPPAIIQHPEFHRTVITRAYPQWRHIPYAEGGRSGSGFSHEVALAARAASFALGSGRTWHGRLLPIMKQWYLARKSTYRSRFLYLSPQRLIYSVQLNAICQR